MHQKSVLRLRTDLLGVRILDAWHQEHVKDVIWMFEVVFGTMVDQIRSVVLLVLVNYFILALWRVFGRPTILMSLGEENRNTVFVNMPQCEMSNGWISGSQDALRSLVALCCTTGAQQPIFGRRLMWSEAIKSLHQCRYGLDQQTFAAAL